MVYGCLFLLFRGSSSWVPHDLWYRYTPLHRSEERSIIFAIRRSYVVILLRIPSFIEFSLVWSQQVSVLSWDVFSAIPSHSPLPAFQDSFVLASAQNMLVHLLCERSLSNTHDQFIKIIPEKNSPTKTNSFKIQWVLILSVSLQLISLQIDPLEIQIVNKIN